ncbi:MAG: VOC family protein [Acidobacteriota bacterium]
MIHGVHVLLYSNDPEADRTFFREVLELLSVDAGGGWLIFGLPPAEAALHPAPPDESGHVHAGHGLLGAVVYFMCDDLEDEVRRLTARGAQCTEIDQARWGRKTTIMLPSGGEIGLYQPQHPTALGLS